MMTNFEIANKFTSKWERGYVNHKNDPGGATYNGVSLRFIKQTGIDINGDGVINIDDILTLYKNQDQKKVDEIFFKAFWRDAKLDNFVTCLPVQVVVYDCNVNTGRGQSAKFLQRAINILGRNSISVDGVIGPQTMTAFFAIVDNGQCDQLAHVALNERITFHKTLASKSPYSDGRDYRPFLKGWLNRCNDLKAYIDQI